MHHKRILALALALLLLTGPALAAAGDENDPLISRSYAEGTFLAELRAALQNRVAAAVEKAAAANKPANGWRTLTLAAGDSVTLGDGQQLVLLSGGVRLTVDSGKLINATLGRESTGGDARTGHRYVAWGGASVTAKAAEGATVAASQGAAAKLSLGTQTGELPQENPFADVPEGAWYHADVLSAYQRGLVNGMTATSYAPQGQLTLAQAVKLAACMRQLWSDGAVTLSNGAPWYASYADYALAQGILDAMPADGWNEPVTRAAFVRLFYRALPETAYGAINDIPDGAVPDVPTDSAVAREVYVFYAAGILTGYGASAERPAHAFGPESNITRAEVATIMNRMFDPDARVKFTIT